MASHKGAEVTSVLDSPEMPKSRQDDKDTYLEESAVELPPATVSRITRISSILTVLVSGVALFSDGYNAQVIGYMEPLFSDLYVSRAIRINPY
jgi:hypothetical protein